MMVRKKFKYVYVRDIVSLYSNAGIITRFRKGIEFSRIWHKQYVVLEPCLEKDIANISTMCDSFSP